MTIRVTNQLCEATSIHWHGTLLPFQMDGVPGALPASPPAPLSPACRVKAEQSGALWCHSHADTQEQTGMFGAIVADPRDDSPIHSDRDHVVQLSDLTDEDPKRVFAKPKAQGGYCNFNPPTALDLFRGVSREMRRWHWPAARCGTSCV